jgi:hypothetical protein
MLIIKTAVPSFRYTLVSFLNRRYMVHQAFFFFILILYDLQQTVGAIYVFCKLNINFGSAAVGARTGAVPGAFPLPPFLLNFLMSLYPVVLPTHRSANVGDDFRLGDEGDGGPPLLAISHVVKQAGKDDNKCRLHFTHNVAGK